MVLGSGPIRIGQGVEFDYSTVHAIWSIREAGYEAIIINNNPETVSTDYTTSDKLYFEPLTVEDVMNVVHLEKPKAIVVSLGGQTAINLAEPLAELGVPIIGTDCAAIRNAEDRGCFERIMEELGIPQPEAEAVTDIEAGVRAAARIGYPVLVRPSYVLGGRAMQIVSNEERLRHYLQTAVEVNEDSPVLVDRYIMGKELEVDAICDGRDVFIPGIMEHVERTGIHSGDSISVYPTFSVSRKAKEKIIDYTVRLGLRIGIVGLYNIQFILDGDDEVYVIEVNPRSSRTVPFLSKSTGVQMAHIATQVILGRSLREQGITEVYGREKERWYVKAPAFSFAKIRGMDSYLSPEMKSTGEAIGYDDKLTRALYKALQATGMNVSNYGTIFVTIADQDKGAGVAARAPFLRSGLQRRGDDRHGRVPARARHPHPHAAQAQRGQLGDHRRAAAGTCELRHQHDRHQPAQHASGRVRDPPHGRREQRDGLHGARDGEGAARRAGGDHAARFDHRLEIGMPAGGGNRRRCAAWKCGERGRFACGPADRCPFADRVARSRRSSGFCGALPGRKRFGRLYV